MGRRILNDALRTMVNADRRGKATALLQPISSSMVSFLNIMKHRGYIKNFEVIDPHRVGRINVELHGRIKDCKALTYRQDLRAKEIEQYRIRMLPTRQSDTEDAPSISESGKPIQYLGAGPEPNIGFDAPTPAEVLNRPIAPSRKRKTISKTSRAAAAPKIHEIPPQSPAPVTVPSSADVTTFTTTSTSATIIQPTDAPPRRKVTIKRYKALLKKPLDPSHVDYYESEESARERQDEAGAAKPISSELPASSPPADVVGRPSTCPEEIHAETAKSPAQPEKAQAAALPKSPIQPPLSTDAQPTRIDDSLLIFAQRGPYFIPKEVYRTLIDIARRLEVADVDYLVHNAGNIRARYEDIWRQLPNELIGFLQPIAYMEYRCCDFEQATKNIVDRAEIRRLAAVAEIASKESAAEAQKTEHLKEQLSEHQGRLERLTQEITELKAMLEQREKEASAELETINAITADIGKQEKIAADALLKAERATEASSIELESDDADRSILSELDSQLAKAIAAIKAFLREAHALA